MAFGIKRKDVEEWKRKIDSGEIAFLTHYWLDDRFPDCNTVTKVGCNDLVRLAQWGSQYDLKQNGLIIEKMVILILIYSVTNRGKSLKQKELLKGW